MNFKEFVSGQIYLGSDYTGTEQPTKYGGRPPYLPSLDIVLPTKHINSPIVRIDYTRNPISIQLQDSTVWYISKPTWDSLNPKVGDRVEMVLEKNKHLEWQVKTVRVNDKSYSIPGI